MSQEFQPQQPLAKKPNYWIIHHKPSREDSKVTIFGPTQSFRAIIPLIEGILSKSPDAKAAFDRLRYIKGTDQKCPIFQLNGFGKFPFKDRKGSDTVLINWCDDDLDLIPELPGKCFIAVMRWAKLEKPIPESAREFEDYAEDYLGPTTEIQGISSYQSIEYAQDNTEAKIMDCWGTEPGFHMDPWEEIVPSEKWGLSASTVTLAIKVSVYIKDVESFNPYDRMS